MPVEPKITRPTPKYEATVKRDGTAVVATVGATGHRDTVLLQAGKGRSILHVPTEEFEDFRLLVDEVADALKAKAAVEHPEVDERLQVPVTPEAAPLPDRQIQA